MSQEVNEKLMNDLREALTAKDGNKALYLLLKEFTGNEPSGELVITNPEGKPLAYLIPPEQRHALHTTEEFLALEKEIDALRQQPEGRGSFVDRTARSDPKDRTPS